MAKKSKPEADSARSRNVGSTLSRYISFVMLVVTILVCAFYFYSVIKGFLLPLFLAVLLAVIFRPFHRFVSEKCGRRAALAAAISTGTIMLLVLVPLVGLLALGIYEGNQLIRDRKVYLAKISEIRSSLGLQKPFFEPLDGIEAELRKLDEMFTQSTDPTVLAEQLRKSHGVIEEKILLVKRMGRDAAKKVWTDDLSKSPAGDWFGSYEDAIARLPSEDRQNASRKLEIRDQLRAKFDVSDQQADFALALDALRDELIKPPLGIGPLGEELAALDLSAEKRSVKYLVKQSTQRPDAGFIALVDSFDSTLQAWRNGDGEEEATLLSLRERLTDSQGAYDSLRTGLFGGPLWNWALEILNPSSQHVNEWLVSKVAGGATRWLPSITNTATTLIVGLLFGLCIMAVALFYFFLDGPRMVNTFMHLSPLDDRHEMELLVEFDKVSRAVVLATLLSAIAQGILGGIGYKLVGLESVFLLTLLTTVLALVPFIGAAAIWVPCCLYVAFIQETTDPGGSRTWLYGKAIFLAVYGAGIISMADNIIKPWVLQGQSKLHPLLALLSVLGGVQALGPIGILVGPMVVAFLQVLLTILQREITSLDEEMKQAG